MRHRDRLLAWLICGPPGHLAAGVADWVELLARHWLARARERTAGGRGRPGRPHPPSRTS